MPRHHFHDYTHPCIYHITLKKADTTPLLSKVYGTPDQPLLTLSPIGQIIPTALKFLQQLHPALRLYQYIIMPDHVHFLIRVTSFLDKGIGTYIGKMKVKATQLARERGIPVDSLFELDFYDRIIRQDQSLDIVFEYIRQNPYRLLVRKFQPEYFSRINNLFNYFDILWQAYGNTLLLRNPFKSQVVCHRADAGTPKEWQEMLKWKYTASNGGVLVSPFISPKEKEVRNMAESNTGKIILITNEPFRERFKPSGHDFQQCESGRLLIIAPSFPLPASRKTFLLLNKLAENIADSPTYC